ncbi:diguanylate cyclase (GGDEF) domain-containing protein [Hyphomicrobium facile]|uniref:Diguanylate cyclase (GGDEF) domain-containing protein n=2 Tax=Hyphomicrobium facile TaxID=51670 RepID=A0A1I7N5F6_9HYPH|nr:diguanylate cyclase (GGDEF) domain-containing protein [Hyphomicrobium facile]
MAYRGHRYIHAMKFTTTFSFGIAAKAALLIVTLGALSAFANWYVLHSAQSLDHVNRTMVERVAPARLALAEAKAALNNVGLAAYKSMAASELEAARAASNEIANQIAAVRQWLHAVSDYFPTRTQDSDAIRDKLRHVEATARQIRDAIESGDKQRRIDEMLDLRFEAALDDTLAQMNRLTNILGGESRETLAEAQNEQARELRIIIAALAMGTFLIVMLALALAHYSVARPLRQLSETALRIREGSARTFAYGDRTLVRIDEIGTLARSFQSMIAKLAAAQETLAVQYARVDAAINNLPQGLCMFDADQNLIVCNRRYAELYELQPEHTVTGTPLRTILQARHANGRFPQAEGFSVENRIAAVRERKPIYTVDELAGGQFIAISHQPMLDGGSVAIHEDITERREIDAKIAHMAHHDALTDLPNRLRFREAMEIALKGIEHGRSVSTLCLDLDHFKTVNDTLGHPVGDALLQAVADRLRACVRKHDLVARLGGDEFAIVQVDADQPHGATILAQRIIAELSAPFEVLGHQVVVGVSIGIAMAPGDGETADQLIKNADMAMYKAKEAGRATYHFFEPGMDAKLQERRALEVDLRKAIEMDELELYYQPLIRLETNEISGFEALVRWQHPTRGTVSPADFIPLAEETGLIGAIGNWVLNRACADATAWPSHIKVAVNLSPLQFKNNALVLQVVAALGNSGLSGQRLELEITEAVMLHDTDATIAMLNDLRALGVRISMDDFGTGYSSLGYLRKFPFDKIKIDRSFIQDLSANPDSIAIVRAVANIGSALGMATTAEGVETEAELAQLRHEGCTEVQGYLFSKPRPAKEIHSLLARETCALQQVAV